MTTPVTLCLYTHDQSNPLVPIIQSTFRTEPSLIIKTTTSLDAQMPEDYQILVLLDYPKDYKQLQKNNAYKILLCTTEHDLKNSQGLTPNDFIIKPFNPKDLILKIQEALQKIQEKAETYSLTPELDYFAFGRLLKNLKSQEEVLLTEIESKLLITLYQAQEEGISTNELLRIVWNTLNEIETHRVQSHIFRLKEKMKRLNPASDIIEFKDGKYHLNKK